MTDASEALDRVWLVLESLAVEHPGMPLKEGVLLAQKVYAEVDWLRREGVSTRPPVGGSAIPASVDPDVLGAWAGTLKAVTSELLVGKKINAIKELRAAHPKAGLKEAKEAIEWLQANPHVIAY